METLRILFDLALRRWKADQEVKHWQAVAKYWQEKSAKPSQDIKDLMMVDAAANGDTDTVKALIAEKANVHALEDLALIFAAAKGRTETVKVLRDAGANVHAMDNMALRLAKGEGHPETATVLENWMKSEVRNQPPMCIR